MKLLYGYNMKFEIKKYKSPNYNNRPDNTKIDSVILHYTQMLDVEECLQVLSDVDRQVSSHYLICNNGDIFSLVDEKYRAWHAGVSYWDGRSGLNDNSIGIEIVYARDEETGFCCAYSEIQMKALRFLLSDIFHRHEINPFYVLGHSDVAPDRKIDPGEAMEWKNLAADGFGVWLKDYADQGLGLLRRGDRGEDVKVLQNDFVSYGYDLLVDGDFGFKTELTVRAFQRHFRSRNCDGVSDSETHSRLLNLVTQKLNSGY